jgi:hypothetical protein
VSLALAWLLKRHGIPSVLRLGVNRSPEHFTAHAWIEVQGIALLEMPDIHERYVAFEALAFHGA